MYCLDANIWIYYLDARLDEYDTVRTSVRRLLGDEPLFTTTVFQMEGIHYLTRRLEDGDEYVERFQSLSDITVANLTDGDVARATEFLEEHPQIGLGGRDATVVAAMDRYDVERLWTHDDALKRLGSRLDWLDVTDPVDS